MRFKGEYWFHVSLKSLRSRKTIVMTEKSRKRTLGDANPNVRKSPVANIAYQAIRVGFRRLSGCILPEPQSHEHCWCCPSRWVDKHAAMRQLRKLAPCRNLDVRSHSISVRLKR